MKKMTIFLAAVAITLLVVAQKPGCNRAYYRLRPAPHSPALLIIAG